MRFHLLGVPHTVTSVEYNACAYTQKIVKFGKMFANDSDVHTIHYGHEDSVLECDEHVTVVTNNDLQKSYGSHNWRKNFFKFDMKDHVYHEFFKNSIREIKQRYQKGDFVLAFWGAGVKPVCDVIERDCEGVHIVEPGIGYGEGHFAKWKVWESYAIMHACGGAKSVTHANPQWNDVVIPNYFDRDDFRYKEKKEDYFLYLGRVYDGKGVNIAIQACRLAKVKLIIAGQKDDDYKIPDDVTFVGYADIEKRRELMSNAKGALIPSTYYEPFGGVQIENLFSGTPTITSDWGAFTENNIHGMTGYRCRTINDFVLAIKEVQKGMIESYHCYDWAMNNFSLDKVRLRYKKYFNDILNVYTTDGWYKLDDTVDINCLSRTYPISISSI